MMEEMNTREKVYELPLSFARLKEGQSLPELGVTFHYKIQETPEDRGRRELLESIIEKEFKRARQHIIEKIEKESVDVRQGRMFFESPESFIKGPKENGIHYCSDN